MPDLATTSKVDEKLYVTGGFDPAGLSDDLHVYDVARDVWTVSTSLTVGEGDTEKHQRANGTFEGHAITRELEVLRDGATAVEHDNALVLLGGLNQESLLARESLLFDKSGVSNGVLPRLRVNRAWHAGLSFDRHDPPIAKAGAAVS